MQNQGANMASMCDNVKNLLTHRIRNGGVITGQEERLVQAHLVTCEECRAEEAVLIMQRDSTPTAVLP